MKHSAFLFISRSDRYT